MRFLYLSILCLLSNAVLFGQIEFVPVTTNSVLETHAVKNGKNLPTQQVQAKITSAIDCPEPDAVVPLFSEGETLYLISGDSVDICFDALFFTDLDTAICKNCEDLLFGTVTADPDNFCFTYVSNSGLILETDDVLIIEVCDDYGCQDLNFPIVVKRADKTIVESTSIFPTESINTICLNNIDLPGEEKYYTLAGCRDENLAQVFLTDSCFEYRSLRFQEMDEVCVEVCNEFCLCDTYTFPISITGPTLSLPFFDDFSNNGPHPDGDLWLDDKVYVNNHMGFRPPSIGVATFDGLDEGGTPYGGGFGAADVLTSGYIDLSGLNSSSNVHLSYYLQPKGNSIFFPEVNDSIVLQFRNDTGIWESVKLHDGLSNSTSPLAEIPFVYRIDEIITTVTMTNPDTSYFDTSYVQVNLLEVQPITQDRFLHNRFQFRFINHCQRSGMQSIWNLDYVRLNSVEIPDGSFNDVAFTQEPGSVLSTYRHMPWDHFDANPSNEIKNSLDINIFNHDFLLKQTDPATWTLTELTTNQEIAKDPTLLIQDGTTDQRDIPPLLDVSFNNPADFSNLIGSFNSGEEDLVFDLRFTLDATQSTGVNLASVRTNDTVHTQTHFSNYFAYDDGSPEAIITGNQNELQIASQFHSNVADTLVGIQFNFPFTGTDLNADFIIKVWLDDLEQSETPIYTSPPLTPILANQFFDTLNAFSTYRLLSETLEEIKVPLPAGNFFVGIQQASLSGSIGIGYDLNSPDNDFQFFRAPGTLQDWRKIIVPGALMIRPMVGGELPIQTSTEELVEPDLSFQLYPNPAQDRIHLALEDGQTVVEDLELMIVNSTGQIMVQQAWQSTLEVQQWSSGIYFLQIRDKKTGMQVKKKFLILR